MGLSTGYISYSFVPEKLNRLWKLDVIKISQSKLPFVVMSPSTSPGEENPAFHKGERVVYSAVDFCDNEFVDDLNGTGNQALGAFLVESPSESPSLAISKENQSEVFPNGNLLNRVVSGKRKELRSAYFLGSQSINAQFIDQGRAHHEEEPLVG